MSVPTNFDEFGPLSAIILPGQDANDLADLIEKFCEQIQPESFVERIYARDAAILTALLEYYRVVKAAVHAELFARSPTMEGNGNSDDARPLANRSQMANMFIGHVQTITEIEMLERNVTRERNNIFMMFTEKRLNALKAALAALQKKLGHTPPSPDDDSRDVYYEEGHE